MRYASVQDFQRVTTHFGLRLSERRAIDVGGTRTVSLKRRLGSRLEQNPLLALIPKLTLLDKGYNAAWLGTSSDYDVDFLDPSVVRRLSGQFDFVVSFDTLEHIPDPFTFCRHLYEITALGGFVYLSTLFRYPYHPSPGDFFRFTADGLLECFEKGTADLTPKLQVVWRGWESDGIGVAILVGKGATIGSQAPLTLASPSLYTGNPLWVRAWNRAYAALTGSRIAPRLEG
jgi:hypothetical protein